MTTQPQPTAALTDADLVDAVTSMSRRMMTALSTERYDEACTQYRQHRAELIRRLARADTASGVTIPTDIAIYAQTILGDMGPDEVDGDSWPTHVATVRIMGDAIDAALADAGTDNGTGV